MCGVERGERGEEMGCKCKRAGRGDACEFISSSSSSKSTQA